jgi:glycosyltransferase involved in cell wall biosynthesis
MTVDAGRTEGQWKSGEEHTNRTILVLADAYLPGHRWGGPLRSLENLIDAFEGLEIEFKVITRNRDFRHDAPYPNIVPGTWYRQGRARVLYLSEREMGPRKLARLVKSTEHEVLYLNSFFSKRFTVMPLVLRRLRMFHSVRTIVAPRGEFAEGALSLKARRKQLYVWISRLAGLHQGIVWHATTKTEEQRIRSQFGPAAFIVVAPELPRLPQDQHGRPYERRKTRGSIRLVYLSRIAPNKGLLTAIQALRDLEGDVVFDIIGPTENQKYWRACLTATRSLPPSVRWNYLGEVESHEVPLAFSRYHALVLPTLGENYGHVIFEALASGCAVVTSDQTPWALSENRVGWELPAKSVERYSRTPGLHRDG